MAQWENDRLTVWTGTQRPFGVRGELAQAFGMPEESVAVIVPDTGSGYGGKHTGEAAVEAARLAKAAGKPVKLVWTREEEFTWAYFRPAGVIDVTAGVTKDGMLTAWDFHNYNSGGSSIRPLYDIPNLRAQSHNSRAPLAQGSYRALAATAGCTGPLHRCSIYGSQEAGRRLNAMLQMGQSRPWPDALEAFTGSRKMDGSAMIAYFQPLMAWLQEQNKGRKCGW